MSQPFLEKVVLVTGAGAGSGIGQEAAKLFAAQGALVYGADLNRQGLEQTQQAIRDEGGRMEFAAIDVSDEPQVAGLLTRIEKEAGRLDVAFNNAGITGGTHRIEDYPLDDFSKVLKVNLQSVFLALKYEIPLMRKSGGGAITNTASVAVLIHAISDKGRKEIALDPGALRLIAAVISSRPPSARYSVLSGKRLAFGTVKSEKLRSVIL